MKKLLLSFFTYLLLIFPVVSANEVAPASSATYLSKFRQHAEFILLPIQVPTFVDISLNSIPPTYHANLSLYNLSTGVFEPTSFIEVSGTPEVPKITNAESLIIYTNLTDSNTKTFQDFSAVGNTPSFIRLKATFLEPVSVSSVQFLLDPTSTKPYKISIYYAKTLGSDFETLALNRSLLGNGVVDILQVNAVDFEIVIEITEPLRISEIKFNNKSENNPPKLRFLAKPNYRYKLFFDPQVVQYVPTTEAPNFNTAVDSEVLKVTSLNIAPNAIFTEMDSDGDGVVDSMDNCPNISNSDQVDLNKNGMGDACEDFDSDGVLNYIDNCPDIVNRNQLDSDGDGVGDACDLEESRFLEKYFWIPWLGIAFGFGVVALIIFSTKKYKITEN